MSDEILVKCEHASKKFCRTLKRSLLYGVQDISSELNPFKKTNSSKPFESMPDLRKDEFWAVKDISFELKRGECLGLIGHNGAGKSTLLKMLNGLIKPDHGSITMKGRIGALIELNVGFNPILTGRENVYIYGAILGFRKKEIDLKYDEIVEFAEMADFMDMPFRSYSSGMKVRLGFAVAAQMEPDVLIIDEVLAVGDLNFTIKCLNKIGDMMNKSAVIFVSHSMQLISRTSTHILVTEKGRAIHYGDNVNNGIDKYYGLTKTQNIKNSGSGKSKITNFKIINRNRNQSTNNKANIPTLQQGHYLHIKFTVATHLKSRHPEIKISIYNNERIPIADIYSANNDFKMHNSSTPQSIEVKIPDIRLSAGKYSLTIAITDTTTKEILIRTDNIGHFQVQSNNTSWSYTNLTAAWTHANAD